MLKRRRLVKAEHATIAAAHNIRKMISNGYDAVVERNRARLTLSPLLPITIYEKRTTCQSSSSNICRDLLEICKILLHVHSRSNEDLLELLLTCTCRDRMSADDILLKTLESIDATADSRLAEHLCSLLE